MYRQAVRVVFSPRTRFLPSKLLQLPTKSSCFRCPPNETGQAYLHQSHHQKDYVVDMRSDVLTKPTPAIRQAMTDAMTSWDDDVYREDSTVSALETLMADTFDKEAALFVPSGTMSNLLAVSCHCPNRGYEVIMGNKSHAFLWEQGGISMFSGLHTCTVPNKPDGTFDLRELEESIRPTDDPHEPRTGLIVAENTHNYCGGKIVPPEFFARLRAVSRQYKIPVHLDGSRLLNAVVGLGDDVSVSDVTRDVDSVSMCLSKGVGAPIGSVLVGSGELIARALRMRKALGGGWRQPGPLAAAALVAWQDARARLKEDHARAKRFAREVMQRTRGGTARIDIDGVHTNIIPMEVLVGGVTAVGMCERLGRVSEEEEGETGRRTVLRVAELNKSVVRFVVYSSLSSEDIDRAVDKLCYVLEEYDRR